MNSVKRRQLEKEFKPQPDSRPINPANKLKLVAGDFYIPKKKESNPLGEDAHFICEQYQTIGVADGVGGWAHRGIDSGEYARELLSNAVFSIRKNYQARKNVDPKIVLTEAFRNTKAKGSSTACIVTLKNVKSSHSYLHAANIGDSGFVVIRDDKIVYRSPVQQGRFNCPYQLGKRSGYSPYSAMELEFPVVAGDVVVVGTDGLFDNVYSNELENVVNLGMKDPEMREFPELLASNIAQYALQRAEDGNYFSPFARAAQQAGYGHVGGKNDDITVVVAYVQPVDESEYRGLIYSCIFSKFIPLLSSLIPCFGYIG